MKASTAETISMEKVVEKSSPSAMERSNLGTWFAGMDWGFVLGEGRRGGWGVIVY